MKGEKKSQKSKEQAKLAKTIESLEKIDEEERTVQEDFALAMAYLESAQGKWSERDKISSALALLLDVKSVVETKLGEGFYDLDQWALALPYLESARDDSEDFSGEEDEDLDKLVYECEDALTYPKFKENFKERVKTVWKDFSKYASELKTDLDKEELDEKGIRAMPINEIFSTALTYNTQGWISKKDGAFAIWPHPGDSLLRCFEWQYIYDQAPARIKKSWKFELGDAPSTDPFLGVLLKGKDGKPENPEFDISTISLWVSGDADEGFSIEAYCKDWEPFLDYAAVFQDEEEVANDAVKEFLGTIVYDKYVEIVEVVDEPSSEKPIKVTDLPKFFADKGIDIHAPTDEILNSTVNYEIEPEEDLEVRDPREDITSGKTMCRKLVDEYMFDETDEVNRLEPDGVSAGFIFYPIDSFKGRGAKKNRDQFRESLKKELTEKAGPDSVKIIGEAYGEENDYIDVLAWDLEKVLEVAQDFFEKSPVSKSAYHVFRKSSGSVILTGPDEEEDSEPEKKDEDK